MASFDRSDYERLVAIARELVAMDVGEGADELAKELFSMAQNVIGQQSPPLFNDNGLGT